jgi:putative nucleotidyltransferase with HDIG domain
MKYDDILNKIIENSKDVNVFLVGGCVRDYILNKTNFDKDIIVDCKNVCAYAQNLADIFDATFVPLDEKNKIYRLVLKDKINYIDVAGIIGDNLESDLKRRDFTINSIAVNLHLNKMIDINNGLDDIKLKIIKGISDKNFYDDPLRLLRAYRFQATLGFDLNNDLKILIDNNFNALSSVAIERINAELLKMFEGEYTVKALSNMGGMLEYLFPIIKEVKKVPENSHHHLSLINHSIETVKQIQEIYDKSVDAVKEIIRPRLALLKLSAFLHDIGKPQTWTIEPDTGRHRFIKHDDVGSKLVVPLLKNLNFSKKQIQYISLMIKNHIYPSQIIVSEGDMKKTYMRFIRKMEDYSADVILLAMADRLSARGPEITEKIVTDNINGLSNLLNYYLEIKDTLKPLPILLDGNDVMKLFNLKPSPKLGKVMTLLKEAQVFGNVNTKSEAICYISSILDTL